MTSFTFRFVDDAERVSGEIEADNIGLAAVAIMGATGCLELARYARYSPQVKELRLSAIPDKAEVVWVQRLNAFSLDIKKSGSRKRKPLRLGV